jgi:hypothetical protein
MPATYLEATGEIDADAVQRAVERRAGQLARMRAVALADCLSEARAGIVRAAEAQRADWLAEQVALPEQAARAFIRGALLGLTPEPTAYLVSTPTELGLGTYERQAHCDREIGRQRMAALDATLARIVGANDISRFLQAAE